MQYNQNNSSPQLEVYNLWMKFVNFLFYRHTLKDPINQEKNKQRMVFEYEYHFWYYIFMYFFSKLYDRYSKYNDIKYHVKSAKE